MNKKTIAIMGIIIILLIGIGFISAGLINYYGKIIGTVTILPPKTEDDCRNDNWKNLVTLNGREFKNQEDCVSYIQTSMCEDFELLDEYLDEFDSFSSCVSYFASKKKSAGIFGASFEDNGENIKSKKNITDILSELILDIEGEVNITKETNSSKNNDELIIEENSTIVKETNSAEENTNETIIEESGENYTDNEITEETNNEEESNNEELNETGQKDGI